MTIRAIEFKTNDELMVFKKILEHAKHDYDLHFPDGRGGKQMQANYQFLLELIERIDNED